MATPSSRASTSMVRGTPGRTPLRGGSVSTGSTQTPAGEFQKVFVKASAAKNVKPDQMVIAALQNASLNLDLEKLKIEAYEPLIEALRKVKTLQEVSITLHVKKSDAQTKTREPPILGDEKMLAAFIKCVQFKQALLLNETLHTLEISDCHIGDAGFAVLFPFIEKSETLQSLVLRGNDLTDVSGVKIASIIKSHTARLQGDQWAATLRGEKPVPGDLHGLTVFDLSANKLTDRTAHALASALMHDSFVTDVLLAENDIGQEGCQELLDMLAENDTLVRVTVHPSQSPGSSAEPQQKIDARIAQNKLERERRAAGLDPLTGETPSRPGSPTAADRSPSAGASSLTEDSMDLAEQRALLHELKDFSFRLEDMERVERLLAASGSADIYTDAGDSEHGPRAAGDGALTLAALGTPGGTPGGTPVAHGRPPRPALTADAEAVVRLRQEVAALQGELRAAVSARLELESRFLALQQENAQLRQSERALAENVRQLQAQLRACGVPQPAAAAAAAAATTPVSGSAADASLSAYDDAASISEVADMAVSLLRHSAGTGGGGGASLDSDAVAVHPPSVPIVVRHAADDHLSPVRAGTEPSTSPSLSPSLSPVPSPSPVRAPPPVAAAVQAPPPSPPPPPPPPPAAPMALAPSVGPGPPALELRASTASGSASGPVIQTPLDDAVVAVTRAIEAAVQAASDAVLSSDDADALLDELQATFIRFHAFVDAIEQDKLAGHQVLSAARTAQLRELHLALHSTLTRPAAPLDSTVQRARQMADAVGVELERALLGRSF